MKSIALILLIALSAYSQATHETNVTVETFIGSGFSGNVDGTGDQTMFSHPSRISFDGINTAFILDSGQNAFNARLRRLTVSDVSVTTLTTNTFTPFSLSSIHFQGPTGQSVFFTTLYDVKSISLTTSNFTTVAGDYQTPGNTEGPALQARFDRLTDIEVLSDGTVLLLDTTANNRIRGITNGIVFTYAGSGNSGYQDGNGIFCSFTSLRAICRDIAGNLFLADATRVRKINSNRDVTTLAGNSQFVGNYTDGISTNASFGEVSGIAVNSSGEIFVSDRLNNTIRKIYPNGNVTTVAGSSGGISGYQNGPGQTSLFRAPSDVAVLNDGSILVADTMNHRIRRITFSGSLPIGVNPSLSLNRYAGINIIGTPGRNYRIESSLEMTNWTQETIISLPLANFLWIDTNSTSPNFKFYRAQLVD